MRSRERAKRVPLTMEQGEMEGECKSEVGGGSGRVGWERAGGGGRRGRGGERRGVRNLLTKMTKTRNSHDSTRKPS